MNQTKLQKELFVRIHSECYTGDTLGSLHCDCGKQLKEAKRVISEHGNGIIIILAKHEGRGIGLVKKIAAYSLMQNDTTVDTFKANTLLGCGEDERNYDDVEPILDYFLVTKRSVLIRLLTDNPFKLKWMRDRGYLVTSQTLETEKHPFTERYMQSKREFFEQHK